MGGARRAALAGERTWLLERVSIVPDLTLRAIQAELATRGLGVCVWTVWRFYEAEGITFQKSRMAAERERAVNCRTSCPRLRPTTHNDR